MTDQELMHQALEALEWASDMIPQQKEPVCDCPICKASDALRERLAQPGQEPWPDEPFGHIAGGVQKPEQPQRTHWEGCEEVHPECKRGD